MRYCKIYLAISLIFLSGCAHTSERLYRIAPAVIPSTTSEMRSPGYWIALTPDADKVVMTTPEIETFNHHTHVTLGLTHDVTAIGPQYSGDELRKKIDDDLVSLEKQSLYRGNGNHATCKFFRDMGTCAGVEAIPESVHVRYAFVIKTTDQRVLPTEEGLYENPGSIEFDELQNSGLDIGDPAAVLCDSRDGLWCYTITRLSEGWVRKDALVFCSAEDIVNFEKEAPRAVIISRQADLFADQALKDFRGKVRMGISLPVKDQSDGRYVGVAIPEKGEGGAYKTTQWYVKRSDVNIGYLQYTPRTIIEQAFKLLDMPYGWGDMHGEGDCSRLIQEVFATVGIMMPRNSKAQGQIGKLLWNTDSAAGLDKKSIIIANGIGGITTLQLQGHIVIYLGSVCNEPYAIHASWAYSEPGIFKDNVRVIRRVVVTGLDLGKGSRKGSLLERIVSIRVVKGG